MKKCLLYLFISIMLSGFSAVTVKADVILWYNGDFDTDSSTLNGIHIGMGINQANAYDDFVVSDTGWFINSVWSNNLISLNFEMTEAMWEIRSGISEGNSGTLIAGGINQAIQTATGRFLCEYNEYTIEVSGLNVYVAPGTYWLTVAPVNTYPSAISFISNTSGLNAINTPAGYNLNAFMNNPSWNYYFASSSLAGYHYGYSMGVRGQPNPIPEPGTIGLLGIGLAGLAVLRKRFKP